MRNPKPYSDEIGKNVLNRKADNKCYRQRNSSIAFSQEWAVTEVTYAQTITVRQTDSNQMQVWLCGIDASELGNEAREKLRSLLGLVKASLVATNENQLMVIPVGKDEQGRTVAEMMVYDRGEAETSFQEELLKSGLARTQQGGVECPNQIAFKNAQRIVIASKTGVWSQVK